MRILNRKRGRDQFNSSKVQLVWDDRLDKHGRGLQARSFSVVKH